MALNEAVCENWFVYIGQALGYTPQSRNTMRDIGVAMREVERFLGHSLVAEVRQNQVVQPPAAALSTNVRKHLNALAPAAQFIMNNPNVPSDYLPDRFSTGFWDDVAARL